MDVRIMAIAASLAAGCIVMVLHELPKSIYVYYKYKSGGTIAEKVKFTFKDIFKLWKYIDPLGLLFCAVSRAGFSRSYVCAGRYTYSRKAGIIGFLSLLIQFFISVLLLRCVFLMDKSFVIHYDNNSGFYVASAYLCTYTAIISLGMLITNFFPVHFFDSALYISGNKEALLPDGMYNDCKFLIILILVYYIDIIPDFCFKVLGLFLGNI